ncbi:hypothetical protein [Algoriphagus boritolerans]|uniref:Uncharacterized protein n=1 Tax=Algoriphagus boritolerans DSM 17298 = JCM 18970 TaxID=1120964 RepID=A0A1H5ZR05_9BACT|nr:hypothetical protein [Algoriphagus boritolerans]SEG38641.1 hypothetical protein SAMN03080598_03672 [Algoriphagus boritolerans DSM 17298 = JCM 18970]
MKAKLLPILMLLFGLISCNDEDFSPEAKIQGTFELVLSVINQSTDEIEFDFYNTYELRSDGTFYREDVTRNVGSDEVLGFRTYGDGTYTISDEIVTFQYENFYSMQIEDIPYLPKDQLTFSESGKNSDQYRVLNNYTQLEYICPSNALCSSIIPPYTKID